MDISAIGNGVVQIGNNQIEKEGVEYFPFLNGQYVYVRPKGWDENIRLKVSETTLDGVAAADASAIIDYLDNAFSSGGGGGAVESVNGQTGAVVLTAENVGALPDTYQADYNMLANKPAVIAAGATDVDARNAIGAARLTVAGGDAGGADNAARSDHVHAAIRSTPNISQSNNTGTSFNLSTRQNYYKTISADTLDMTVTGGVDNVLPWCIRIFNSDAANPHTIGFTSAIKWPVGANFQIVASGCCDIILKQINGVLCGQVIQYTA